MDADPTEAVEALLVRTMEAHGTYEETELNGVYDQQWPRWYAAFAVENGLGLLVGHDVNADQVGEFLASSNAEFEQADPKPTDSWQAYTARRITAEL